MVKNKSIGGFKMIFNKIGITFYHDFCIWHFDYIWNRRDINSYFKYITLGGIEIVGF